MVVVTRGYEPLRKEVPMEPILVSGGTGTLGKHVVRRLRDAGGDVRVLSRKEHADGEDVRYLTGDLMTGLGLDAAVAGVRTIVHCAGGPKGDDVATRNLVTAAARAGRPHIVNVSVVGADRVPVHSFIDRNAFGYFDMKRKTEQVVEGSGLPWTTLRATQFYDLVFFVAEKLTKLPVVPYPTHSEFQPVDTDEVAARMVELALAEPAGLVPDIAGPRVYEFAALIRGYLRAAGRSRPMLPVHVPGGASRAVRGGAVLAPDRAVGKRTWEEYLADRFAQMDTRS
jgi:uncharacterized protein YbjT (DUF2867 family)